jgi:hypothetical protein
MTPVDDGYKPEIREGHTAVRINQFIYVIGGCDYALRQCYRDTNVLDTKYMWWKKLSSHINDLSAKEQFVAEAVGSVIYTFGGRFLMERCTDDFVALETGLV